MARTRWEGERGSSVGFHDGAVVSVVLGGRFDIGDGFLVSLADEVEAVGGLLDSLREGVSRFEGRRR